MGIFTEDTKIKLAPRTTESIYGGQALMDLAGKETPTVPQQGVAGLTPMQMLVQQYLGPLMGQIGEAGQLATDEYRRTLTDQYDPLTSPYYAGLRTEAERLKKEGVTDIRQRAELGGMAQSTPAIAQEGEFVNQANSALLTELGRLTENERTRKTQAAEGIQRAGAQQAANLGAVSNIAEQQRLIEQQQFDVLFNQLMMQIMFPYQYQAGLYQSLLNYSPDTVTMGGGLTDFGTSLMIGSNFARSIGSTLPQTSGGGGGSGASSIGSAAAARSDKNSKNRIVAIDSALDKVSQLDGKTYYYNDTNARRYAGVIAQDVEKVLPEAVEVINGVRYVRFDGMIALLVNAVNELRSKVEEKAG